MADMKPEYLAEFRFYAELNDFLPPLQRQRKILYRFSGHPGVKDPIEVFGVPHTEVELLIVNGESVGFDYQLQADDRVAVYPVFKSLDTPPLLRLREKIAPKPRFVLDVNLGKLAKLMRLLGFDCLYRNDFQDKEVGNIAVNEHRIVLTVTVASCLPNESSMAIGFGRWTPKARSLRFCAVSTCTAQFTPLSGAWFATVSWRRLPRRIFWIVSNPKPGFTMRHSISASIAGVFIGKGRTWKICGGA